MVNGLNSRVNKRFNKVTIPQMLDLKKHLSRHHPFSENYNSNHDNNINDYYHNDNMSNNNDINININTNNNSNSNSNTSSNNNNNSSSTSTTTTTNNNNTIYPLYDIIGVIYHIGKNVTSGHYILYFDVYAFLDGPESCWMCFNDHKVTEVDGYQNPNMNYNDHVKAEIPYFVIYKLRDHINNN
jgi:uncharacterized UBP type Zn finger protein